MRGFYVSARNPNEPAIPGVGARPMVALGPFQTREEAERYVAPVSALTEELDPVRAPFLEFGTACVDQDILPAGPGNERFGLAMLDGYVLTAERLIGSIVAAADPRDIQEYALGSVLDVQP